MQSKANDKASGDTQSDAQSLSELQAIRATILRIRDEEAEGAENLHCASSREQQQLLQQSRHDVSGRSEQRRYREEQRNDNGGAIISVTFSRQSEKVQQQKQFILGRAVVSTGLLSASLFNRPSSRYAIKARANTKAFAINAWFKAGSSSSG
jgi:hypothetical protein